MKDLNDQVNFAIFLFAPRDTLESTVARDDFAFGEIMGERGVEPLTLTGQDPKSCAYANSATRPKAGRVYQIPH